MTVMLSTFHDVLGLKQRLEPWLKEQLSAYQQSTYTVFFSYGDRSARCKVWSTTDKEANVVVRRTLKFIDQYFEKKRQLPEFLKFDVAVNVQEKSWAEVDKTVNTQNHNNHYRKGLSFDPKFEICFLEQEIYGKAIIKGLTYSQPNFFDEKNLNDAVKAKYPKTAKVFSLNSIEKVWTFDTVGTIYENQKLVPLQSTGPENGVRYLQGNKKDHVRDVILKNADFLHGDIQENGRFVYGYFPAYDRELRDYNTVRHCTSVYALIETFEVKDQPHYWERIHKAIEFALENFYKEIDANTAHMIDYMGKDVEIKLGSNAAAVMMLAKYQETTGNNQYQGYAEKIANGIRSMIDEHGETTHVLLYPSLEVKEKFRIIYYDGEAALGMLRLYQLNGNTALLDTVKQMFDHFIAKSYHKYHDHWLSYCTNELIKINPEKKYYEFGLNNYLQHLKFIRDRKTAYATFLEMLMSAYKMVSKLKEQGQDELFAKANFEALKDVIEHRVEYQRTGIFYPEVAMYMAKPEKILNAFYVRHDRFRTRIDDQEHNLSGYVAYLNYFEV